MSDPIAEFRTDSPGTYSEDIFIDLRNEKSEEEMENNYYHDLRRYKEDGEILWGVVTGVEHDEEHAYVCVIWNKIKVLIPDTWYFEPEYNFGKNYETMTPHAKLQKRIRQARFQINARICFKVTNVDRHIIETEGPLNGKYEVVATGNRIAAMATLRDIYFLHKNRKATDKAPRTVKEGDLVRAHVLAVKDDLVLVEVAGVETRLGTHNLLSNDFVENCCDVTAPGESLKVRVKKVYVNADDSIHLSVTGRVYDVSKMINSMQVGSFYLGTVEKYNAEKKVYTIILSVGVLASVPEDCVNGRIQLYRGDKVSVYVSNIYETFVAGSCMKV